jgi:snurportin-1
MYAELLEIRNDDVWPLPEGVADGLPEDLESGWVAVAPVPIGKRCLAVTHQSSGVVGVGSCASSPFYSVQFNISMHTVPNTSLRSRVLGKSLIVPFPSKLPPQTILDCILDTNWRDNGILHVLDVIQWKGQDVGDCETPFRFLSFFCFFCICSLADTVNCVNYRFWWRDTRLAELPRSLPPSNPTGPSSSASSSKPPWHSRSQSFTNSPSTLKIYHFPYPTSFLPIPYHTNTALPHLSSYIIPLARSVRLISVDVPLTSPPPSSTHEPTSPSMDIDNSNSASTLPPPPMILTSLPVNLQSDGLLLYVAQASYEPGTSPLSSWIPISIDSDTEEKDLDLDGPNPSGNASRPLDLFERCAIFCPSSSMLFCSLLISAHLSFSLGLLRDV